MMRIAWPKFTWLLVRRLIKTVFAVNVCFALVAINPVYKVMGTVAYISIICCVNLHPGRRVGTMLEAVVLAIVGTLFGLAYGIFGQFIFNITNEHHGMQTALGLLAFLEIIMLFIHGFVRSYSPRLFTTVFFMFVVVHFMFVSNLTNLTYHQNARNYAIPIGIGIAVSLSVNILIFPEFGSSELGVAVADCVNDIRKSLKSTVDYFTRESDDKIELIVQSKGRVRAHIQKSRTMLVDALFEISYSYLSPRQLKPLIKKLNQLGLAYNALVGACELEFALLGDASKDSEEQFTSEFRSHQAHREIEYADKKVLGAFIEQVKTPIIELARGIDDCFNVIAGCISYGYDVKCDDKTTPDLIDQMLTDISMSMVSFDSEIANKLEEVFLEEDPKDRQNYSDEFLMPRDEFFLISSYLMNLRQFATTLTEILSDCKDIVETRRHRETKGFFGRGLWFSGLSSRKLFKKYLTTGEGEQKETDVASLRSHTGVKGVRQEEYEEEKRQLRGTFADMIEYPLKFKQHLKFAFNFTLLLMLVSFPAFIPSTRNWYTRLRGSWVGFVACIALESSIGATFQVFLTRCVGLTLGSAWGYMSYVVGDWGRDRYVLTLMMVIGSIIPFYMILNTKMTKAGQVCVVSAHIVVLSTLRPAIPGTIAENFAKRCISMLVGGTAALMVQVAIFPVKGRVQLVKCVITAIQCCERIEGYIAQGIDKKEIKHGQLSYIEIDLKIHKLYKKAKAALNSADVFREAAKNEVRLKGSFGPYERVYKEIIFVLHQILDKFQNVSFLRKHYGSAIQEDLSDYVYLYRREFYGCLTSTLRAVEEALANKTRMPQYLPSTRVAHLRIVNRVREILAHDAASQAASRATSRRSSFVNYSTSSLPAQSLSSHLHLPAGLSLSSGLQPLTSLAQEMPSRAEFTVGSLDESEDENEDEDAGSNKLTYQTPLALHTMSKQKYMSWSATSAGLEEIVEYVEELVELTKLIVGVNEFKFGFLSRPLLDEKDQESSSSANEDPQIASSVPMLRGSAIADDDDGEDGDELQSLRAAPTNRFIRRTFTVSGNEPSFDITPMSDMFRANTRESNATISSAELPTSLQRVISRRRQGSKGS